MAEADDDINGGLFSIALSSDDEGDQNNNAGNPAKETREQKLNQTEEQFQSVKASYGPKIENGDIWKSVRLPIEGPASKPQAQELLHAVEELYFFRRFAEAAAFARRVLESSAAALDDEHRGVLELYEARCRKKMPAGKATTGCGP